MLKYNQELEKWNRRESPLVSFSRSLRMETATSATSEDGKSTEGGEPQNSNIAKSPLDDIDVDSLPDDIRDKFVEANKTIKAELAKTKDIETNLQKANDLARNHQSRADRLYEKLKGHNLHEEGSSNIANGSPANDEIIQALAAEYRADGMDEKNALAVAKTMSKAFKVMQPRLMQQLGQGLGPTIATVADMHANTVLAEAQRPENDKEGLFEIPEVAAAVKENVELIVKNGGTITANTVANLKDMAYGRHLRANPGASTKTEPVKVSTRMPGQGQHSFSTPPARGARGNAPVAANEATAEAMGHTIAIMQRGLPSAKKGAK